MFLEFWALNGPIENDKLGPEQSMAEAVQPNTG